MFFALSLEADLPKEDASTPPARGLQWPWLSGEALVSGR